MEISESEIKTLFLDIVSILTLCRDVNMESSTGEVIEYGITISDKSYITYRESNRTLHFHHNDVEVLALTEKSPLLFMIRELLYEVENTDPDELRRARFRILD